ncbi:winged helix-turn-helix transcriptional regulator [Yoonia sp. 2307UL14-13]|uniref:winged helix-turn-helix transcriptional regulator n=1 Tax=Yoonia sp. 2307UL14-13 TaxID=3126506 RepID=UPI00309C5489
MKNTTYRSDCPIASTLDLIGDKWTLLILRDMLFGARKFSDFVASAEGMKRNILSDRLKRLNEHGLIERVPYQDKPPRFDYVLTAKGADLLPVIQAIARWGANHLEHAYDPPADLLKWMPSDHAS